MNIVLTSIHISKSPDAIPLAPALLKGYLEAKLPDRELQIKIMDTTLDSSTSLFVDQLLATEPDIIGLSIYLWNRDYYIKLAKAIKKINKNIIIIAGGPEMRSGFTSLLSNGIDYTMQGEGEEIIYELVNSLLEKNDPLSIPGINDNTNRFIADLDTIPSPLLENNINLSKYDGYLWELSRGCPYSCDFCFESRGSKGVRYYNFDRIEKELDVLIFNNIPQVFVLDPTFNKDIKRAKKILHLIKKKNKGTHFHFEIRAELIDKELAKLFHDIGASLQIGIQSSNDEILQLINRRLDKKLFTSKIALLNQSGSIFGLDLIYGLPGDNYTGFKNSMEYVLSLQPNHLDIFPLAVLPGTTLWDNSENLKLNFRKTTPYTIINSPTYSIKDMDKSTTLKESCDFIYNQCKSTGWLMQVCKELNISMTDFIEAFYPWKNYNNSKKLDITTLKLYIRERFTSKSFDLIDDTINYHTAYSKALLGKKEVSNLSKLDIINSSPKLSKTCSLLRFKYPLLSAFDNGDYTIKSIKKYYRPEMNKCVSWFHSGGEVVFECYSKEIMSFLFKIDGKTKCKDLDKHINLDFLLFAQSSGMILFT